MRGAGSGRTRVKTARKRTAQSTRWLERQLNDPYVKQAKAEGYRSRAAYKLIELDEKFAFLKGAKRVVDLGLAPGGWSQVVRRAAPKAAVVGIDLLPVDPIDGVAIVQMDFMDDAAPGRLIEQLGGASKRLGCARIDGCVGRAAIDCGILTICVDSAINLTCPTKRLDPIELRLSPRCAIWAGRTNRRQFLQRAVEVLLSTQCQRTQSPQFQHIIAS